MKRSKMVKMMMTFATFCLVSKVSMAGRRPYVPRLQLVPNRYHNIKALGEDVYLSCSAIDVKDLELITEMKWMGPNGREIPNSDNTRIITMAGADGPEILDLMIQKLEEQDSGTYECSATYAGNQKLTKQIDINVYLDITFGDMSFKQTLIFNNEGKIHCKPIAKPDPQVDWLKDSTPLRNDDNHIIMQDGLLIKKVTEDDEGIYRCRARVLQFGSIDYRDIQVEVYIPPRIDIVPEDTYSLEKESATFSCGATGKPLPTYSWVNEDNEPLDDKDGYYVDSEEGYLTIMYLRPEQSGTYSCTANNPAGEDFATARLVVLTKPKVEEYLNITLAKDTDAEMRCIATGDPIPEIVYKKESETESFITGINYDNRIEVIQDTDDQGRTVGILKIRGVARSDDGQYTCTAQSEGGVTQVWGHITVEFIPTFEEQLETDVWSFEQEPVKLTCLATSIPNATIQWYLHNEEINPTDPNLHLLALGPLGVLKVIPSQSYYYGVYTCQATNYLGRAEYDLNLTEAHVPGPVSYVQVEKKTATTITWGIIDPIDNGGLPIQAFLVEYRIRDLQWDSTEKRLWTKGSSYTLDGLIPQETYVFRFAAKNEAGEGERGDEMTEEMPKRAVPEEPLIFNADSSVIEYVEIPYKEHYVLQWQVPLDNGEPIDHFQIMYYKVHTQIEMFLRTGDKTIEESDYPGATSYIIKNLRPGTYYKIELRAHNVIGYSTAAKKIIKTAANVEPSLQLSSNYYIKALGDGVYVECSAIVDDPEQVTQMKWMGPNGQEIPNSDNTIITMEGIGGPGKLDLMIQKLEAQDIGTYNCSATYAGNQKLSAELVIESYMDITFGDTHLKQTLIINSEGKIHCKPHAVPAPIVDWLKDSGYLKTDDNHIIQQDGVLIKNVTEDDEGVYKCRARVPQLGSIDYREIQVEVLVPEDANGGEQDSGVIVIKTVIANITHQVENLFENLGATLKEIYKNF